MEQKSIRDFPKSERIFFENYNEKIEYNKKCLACAKCSECGQSFRAIVFCKNEIKCKAPKQYMGEIKKKGKTVQEIAKLIKVNSRTLNSMLIENQDMIYNVHQKLMKELFDENI